MNLSRRTFLFGAAASALAQQRPNGPNVIVILADDLGYGELSIQGGDIPTPNIDSIAKDGVRFTNGYVSCPVCSPTRAGLMTGRYQQRFGHEFNPGPAQEAEEEFGLPLTEKTLANRMKELGYATGMVGKWHLGYKPEYHPMKRGFDEYFGFLGGAHSYVDARGDRFNAILRGTEPVDEKEYLTDAFAREAEAFIGRHSNHPFFLYFTPNAVHGPLQPPERYTATEKRQVFTGMLKALDECVGRVQAALRKHKIDRNTLLVFVSDNGGPTMQTSSKNGVLRGFKGQTLEGGIRVAFMMSWPGQIPKGVTYDQPVISLDILPTAVAAAGGKVSGIDGVDLTSYAAGKNKGTPHETLCWRFGLAQALRRGDWKLVRNGGDWELYNLREDIGESKNLAAEQPAKLKELAAAWDAWNAQLMAPKWKGRQANRPRNPGQGRGQGQNRRQRRLGQRDDR